jgi:hypothetical protein
MRVSVRVRVRVRMCACCDACASHMCRGGSRRDTGKVKVMVPSSAVSVIIGKAGKNIRELEAMSGGG